MKIESVNVTVFQYPTRRVSDTAGHSHPGPESMAKMAMLTITADDGTKGYAFAPPEVVRPFVVNTFFRKVMIGQDAFNRERIWQDLAHWQRGSAHQLTERALGFVEQALWDLIGRKLKMPVWKLLGGYRDKVPAYGSTMCGDDLPGGLSTPDEYASFAEKLVARGYKAIKLHTWMPPVSFAPNPKMDVKACAAVREAVGPDIDLMIDGYHWYSRAEALYIGKALEKLDFAWFEEPMEEEDNTFLSPALQNPLALGADLVLHSCTKYLNGHSDVVAGVVIAKDPELVTELAWWANNIGVTAGAFDSYLLLRGLRTLSPRMEVAQRNAQAIVEFLKNQPLVKKLYHPSLPENQGHEIAARQQKGFGAMLSFELDGDEQTLRRFLSGLSLFTLAESLGGVESLISHAATMTHAGMAPEARAAAGISETLLRISTGIEDCEDLIADLENAFRVAAKG